MIVLDANTAVSISRKTAEGDAFLALIDACEGEPVVSCDLFSAEVRNAFWQYVKAGVMGFEDASECVQDALGLVDEFTPIEELGNEAFAEAVRLRRSVYDMLYLCLARRRDATLFTLDKRLAALCEEAGVNCVREVALPEGSWA